MASGDFVLADAVEMVVARMGNGDAGSGGNGPYVHLHRPYGPYVPAALIDSTASLDARHALAA